MSDKPRDLTLERVNRLTQAVADLVDNQTAQGRMLLRLLQQIAGKLDGLDAIRSEIAALNTTVRQMAIEQTLLGNRVENAFAPAVQANIRLDEMAGSCSGSRQRRQ
jgi:outer membrane murein-binding lipoprotein Lpp